MTFPRVKSQFPSTLSVIRVVHHCHPHSFGTYILAKSDIGYSSPSRVRNHVNFEETLGLEILIFINSMFKDDWFDDEQLDDDYADN